MTANPVLPGNLAGAHHHCSCLYLLPLKQRPYQPSDHSHFSWSFSLFLVRLRPKRTYGLMTQRGCRRAIGLTVIRWPPAAIGANGRPLFGPGDAESFHLPTHCGTFHPKAGRGPLRAAQHPAGLAESAKDVLPFSVG